MNPFMFGLAALVVAAFAMRRAARPSNPPAAAGGRAAAVQTIAAAAWPLLGRLTPLAVAQAMVETGYGRAVPGNNWFGIKGKGPAGSVNVPTREEFSPGVTTRIRANFRAYPDASASVTDYAKFVLGGRYAPAAKMSPSGAVLWIWAQGYATATNYPAAVAAVSRSAAARVGDPKLAFSLSPAQIAVAAELATLPAGRKRAAASSAMLTRGSWPA